MAVPSNFIETPVAPRSGDIVTFTYQNYSSRSIPIHPTIVRIREDLTWEEVVTSFLREKPQAHKLNGMRAMKKKSKEGHHFNSFSPVSSFFFPEDSMGSVSTPRPFGYWTSERRKNLRKFFESFAKSYDLDPLLPETWYNIPLIKLKDVKVCYLFLCLLLLRLSL